LPFDADRAWTQTTEGSELKADDLENIEPTDGALMLLLMQRRDGKRLRATAVPRTEAALSFKVENIVESGRRAARVDAISISVCKAEAAKRFECNCRLLLTPPPLPPPSSLLLNHASPTGRLKQCNILKGGIDISKMSRGLTIWLSFKTECLFHHTTASPEGP
jgi:hypothetical protein